MAAEGNLTDLNVADWEDEEVNECVKNEQKTSRFATLQEIDLNSIVTESYSKGTKANTKWAAKVFKG